MDNTNKLSTNLPFWLEQVTWNEQGLVPVIAQDALTKQVLMMAWMNAQTLAETVQLGQAVYWSRSRNKRWLKGEESGHFQKVQEIYLDCDGDTIILMIEQTGVACHTGTYSCFFKQLQTSLALPENAPHWKVVENN